MHRAAFDVTPQRQWLVAGLLGLLTLAVFLPAVSYDFVDWDDGVYTSDNPLVLGGLSLSAIRRAFTEVVLCNWAPLTTLSYQTDATLFGTQPWGFHLTNVFIHALSVAILYVAVCRMTGCPGRSAAAAFIYGMHPLRVESVAWISERKDVLSVLFLMVALLAYERYCRAPTYVRYAQVLLAVLTSLLCKATLVTFPALLILIDVWPLGRLRLPGIGVPVRCDGRPLSSAPASMSRLVLEKLPFVALSLVFVIVTLITQKAAISSEVGKPFLTCRVPNALYALTWYVSTFFWPVRLGVAYRHLGADLSWTAIMAISIAVVTAIAAAWSVRRLYPWITWGLAWLLVSLVPMLGLVQAGEQGYADRFSYIPHIGFTVAVVWTVAHAWDSSGLSWRLGLTTLVVGAAGLVAMTERQLATWRNSDTLWRHAIVVDPDHFLAHTYVGMKLLAAGDREGAKHHYQTAFRASGGALNVCARLAALQFEMGDVEEARELRDAAIRLDPNDNYTTWLVKVMRVGPPQHVSDAVKEMLRGGLAEARAGRMSEALSSFERAAAEDPRCADAHNNVGMALVALDRPRDAVDAFSRAVEINALHADYQLNCARALYAIEQYGPALRHCEAALACDPTDTAIMELHAVLTGTRTRP